MKIEEKIERLHIRYEKMREYLLLKLDEEDLHGVADAAMDMRDIKAEIRGLLFMKGNTDDDRYDKTGNNRPR